MKIKKTHAKIISKKIKSFIHNVTKQKVLRYKDLTANDILFITRFVCSDGVLLSNKETIVIYYSVDNKKKPHIMTISFGYRDTQYELNIDLKTIMYEN